MSTRKPALKADSIFEEKQEDKREQPKSLTIVRVPNGLFAIRYTAGGEVPAALKGHWTSPNRAQDAIDVFLAQKSTQETTTGSA